MQQISKKLILYLTAHKQFCHSRRETSNRVAVCSQTLFEEPQVGTGMDSCREVGLKGHLHRQLGSQPRRLAQEGPTLCITALLLKGQQDLNPLKRFTFCALGEMKGS